jgi:hypothetical protein
MSIETMMKEFKDFSELHMFAEAQQRSLIDLSKKVKKLEDENAALKRELNASKMPQTSQRVQTLNPIAIGDDEMICRRQLSLLREQSMERELTLEEARRFEIFTKTLTSIENKPKVIEVQTRGLSNDELLALADQS